MGVPTPTPATILPYQGTQPELPRPRSAEGDTRRGRPTEAPEGQSVSDTARSNPSFSPTPTHKTLLFKKGTDAAQPRWPPP